MWGDAMGAAEICLEVYGPDMCGRDRHCERSEAIHLTAKKKEWIASSQELLAMTGDSRRQASLFGVCASITPSCSSSHRFRSSPPPYLTSVPLAPIRRWQGTTT